MARAHANATPDKIELRMEREHYRPQAWPHLGVARLLASQSCLSCSGTVTADRRLRAADRERQGTPDPDVSDICFHRGYYGRPRKSYRAGSVDRARNDPGTCLAAPPR
jgi:hypothetical protein